VSKNLDYSADVAIIGSGIAGSLIATKLAKNGIKVIVLEAGIQFSRQEALARQHSTWKVDNSAPYPKTKLAPLPTPGDLKDNYVLSLNFDKVMLDKLVQFREHLYSIYYDFQPEKTDIGLINKPFGDLYLKGNAISSEPTEDNHLATKKYVDENGGIAKLEDDLAPKLSAILDCNYKKLVNVQNPSSTYDGVNKGYVDPFRIYSNSTNLNGASTHTIVAGEFNTILVVENTIASSLDMTIQPAVGNFVDIFNDTEFDLTIISSNGINIRSLNNNVKIPKYGKATLKSGGGYYMLYGDLKA